MKKEKKAVLVLFTAFSLSHATAQEPDSSKTLQEVIVTAKRMEEDPASSGRSVTLISSAEIEKMNYRNVGELLTAQEGIYVAGANQTPGSVQTLFMRGTGSNQTVVMIDGIRITDPSSVGNAADLSELSLSNVDRIEIVRGAHSTLYGSSAIGGVINIITKKGTKNGFSGNLNAEAGVFDPGGSVLGQHAFVAYRDSSSGVYANASAYHVDVKGMDATIDTVTNPFVFKNRDKDDFSKLDLNVKAGIQRKKGEAYFSYRKSDQLADIDRGAYNDDENYILEFGRQVYSVGAQYHISEKFRVQYNGGISSMKRYSENDSSVIDASGNTDHSFASSEYKGTTQSHDLQFSYLHKHVKCIAGGGFYSENMNINSYYTNSAWMYESKMNFDTLNMNISTVFAYAQAMLNGNILHEKLGAFDLTMGMRINDNSSFGNYATFEINPSVKLSEKNLLFLSYATSFNAPSLYQLYSPEDYYGYGLSIGNKTLQPEKGKSIEIGIKQSLGKKSLLTVSWFRNEIRNMIDYVYLWDKNVNPDSLNWSNMIGDTYLNVGTMVSNGIELSFRSELSDKVYLIANASLVNGRISYDPANSDASHTMGHHIQIFTNGIFLNKKQEFIGLSRRPNTARITIGYRPIANLDLSTSLRMTGSRSDVFYDYAIYPNGALNSLMLKDYSLLDINASFRMKKWFSFTFRAENILNEEYMEISGFRCRGRSFYGGVQFRF